MESSVDADPLNPTPKLFERSGLTYTSCYCEENIYCMVRDHIDPPDRKLFTVVFISNEEKCSPLFHQKSARNPKIPVCWDYHVVLVYKPATENPTSMVYDFDTALEPFGLPFETYFSKTIHGDESLWSELDPEIDQEAVISFMNRHPLFFKLVLAEDYLRLFASTRKHMMKEPSIHRIVQEDEDLNPESVTEVERWEDSWLAKPPGYPPITTRESDDTLAKFLDFGPQNRDRYGRIVDKQEFWREFTVTRTQLASQERENR